jgi:hypothetical protein
MSLNYVLFIDDAQEDNVFYRRPYDHTTGPTQDLCRTFHRLGSGAHQALGTNTMWRNFVTRSSGHHKRPHQTLLGAEAYRPHSQESAEAAGRALETAPDTARSGGLRAPLPESADAACGAPKDHTRHYWERCLSPAAMLSRFVKRHSGFTRRFAVAIPEMVLVTMVMDIVPVTCTDVRATILSVSSISLDKPVSKVCTTSSRCSKELCASTTSWTPFFPESSKVLELDMVELDKMAAAVELNYMSRAQQVHLPTMQPQSSVQPAMFQELGPCGSSVLQGAGRNSLRSIIPLREPPWSVHRVPLLLHR